MNDKLSHASTIHFLATNYPGLNIEIQQSQDIFGNKKPPINFLILESCSSIHGLFTSSSIHTSKDGEYEKHNNCNVLFHSICMGINSTHSHINISNFINENYPEFHYSKYIIDIANFKELDLLNLTKEDLSSFAEDEFRKLITEQQDFALQAIDEYGKDFLEFINRATCHFVSNKYFANHINLITQSDLYDYGEDILETIDKISSICHIKNQTIAYSMISNEIKNYGIMGCRYCLEKSIAHYKQMRSRFDIDIKEWIIESSDLKFMYEKYRYQGTPLSMIENLHLNKLGKVF
jgi:hypothetical protein